MYVFKKLRCHNRFSLTIVFNDSLSFYISVNQEIFIILLHLTKKSLSFSYHSLFFYSADSKIQYCQSKLLQILIET